MIEVFKHLCNELGVPLSKDKLIPATTQIVFLGILLDGILHILAIPLEKRNKAIQLIQSFLDKKKAMVRDIQGLVGLLNFLNKAIVPGRAFTRRMYAKYANFTLKPHHHINLDREFRSDCKTWLNFLLCKSKTTYCRPMLDKELMPKASDIGFCTDSSAAETLGFGGVIEGNVKQWFLVNGRKVTSRNISLVSSTLSYSRCV